MVGLYIYNFSDLWYDQLNKLEFEGLVYDKEIFVANFYAGYIWNSSNHALVDKG